MSKPMEKAVENIDTVIEQVSDEKIINRLTVVKKILSQNRKKIWLRTKNGKPMAEESLALTDQLLNKYDDHTLTELEAQADKINEESRRRDMVVT